MELSSTILNVTDLTVSYGQVEAVHSISLSVGCSEVVALLGANGAGKTTILEALMGLLPSQGSVHYKSRDIGTWSVENRVRSGMALVPETRDLFGDMTVLDNLELGAYSRHVRRDSSWRSDMNLIMETFPRLRERRSQIAGTLSGGERQMLAIGRALMSRPQLLMLDEPSLGLAPKIAEEIFEIIIKLRSQGLAVLIVEQNAHAALKIADRGYVLETGGIVQQGDARQLLTDPRLIDIYMGSIDN